MTSLIARLTTLLERAATGDRSRSQDAARGGAAEGGPRIVSIERLGYSYAMHYEAVIGLETHENRNKE